MCWLGANQIIELEALVTQRISPTTVLPSLPLSYQPDIVAIRQKSQSPVKKHGWLPNAPRVDAWGLAAPTALRSCMVSPKFHVSEISGQEPMITESLKMRFSAHFTWDVSHELTVMNQAPQALAAATKPDSQAPLLTLDRLYELKLSPQAAVMYAAKPAKLTLNDSAQGGLVRFHADKSGIYRIS